MIEKELRERLDFTLDVARQSGEIALKYYRSTRLKTELKGDLSPVTVADREIESYIRERIKTSFPMEGILGEEFGFDGNSNECRWIIDPIDGTQSFISGVPQFGILIALEVNCEPILGVVNLPAMDELVYAAKNLGAWWIPNLSATNGFEKPRKARISNVSRLEDALFCYTSVKSLREFGYEKLVDYLMSVCRCDRGWGDCFGHILVATGRADFMLDPGVREWDIAALKPIVEEAGGILTDMDGSTSINVTSALSANPAMHSTILEFLKAHQ